MDLNLHLYGFAFVQMCADVRSHRLTFLWKLWEAAVNTRALPISAWWMDLQQTLQISSKYFTKWRKSFTNLRLMFCQKHWWKIALLRIEKHRIVNKNEHRHSYLAGSTWYPKRKPGSPKGNRVSKRETGSLKGNPDPQKGTWIPKRRPVSQNRSQNFSQVIG